MRSPAILFAAVSLLAAGCTTAPLPPGPPPPPLPGPLPPFPPPGPGPAVCNAARASFVLGERARPAVLERATLAAGARIARVVSPGEAVTMEFRPDRLTIRVNGRNRIVDLACG